MIRIATSFNVALILGLFKAINLNGPRFYSVTSLKNKGNLPNSNNSHYSIEDILNNLTPSAHYTGIHNRAIMTNFRSKCKDTSGVYGIYCKPSGKIYIGSAIDLYSRVRHGHLGLNTIRSYYRLKRAINRYG